MNAYNLDFLIAALIIVMVFLFHFRTQRNLKDVNGKIFSIFLTIGIFDIVLELISSSLMASQHPYFNTLNMVLLTLFYIMQALIPFCLVLYSFSLFEFQRSLFKKLVTIFFIPTVIMIGMSILNYWTHWFFMFDSMAVYQHGPLYLTMYIYAIVYAILLGVVNVVSSHLIDVKKRIIIWEFLAIMAVCTLVQAINSNVLMTGFGIGIGLVVLMLTVNNPHSYTDNLTGVFDQLSFSNIVRELNRRKSKYHIVLISFSQLRQINVAFGAQKGDLLIKEIVKQIEKLPNDSIFRMSGKRFVILTQSLEEYTNLKKELVTLFNNDFIVGNDRIRCPATLCGVIDAQTFDSTDELLAYVDYLSSLNKNAHETILIQGDEKSLSGFRYEQEVEQFLSEAIEKDLFEVYYQPVYSTELKTFVSLEALVRLKHPTLGWISPDVFIPIAERNGTVSQIGYLQFKKVCDFVSRNRILMQKMHNIKFNLSPRDILNVGYSKTLIQLIHDYQLPYTFFQFEITETTATIYSDNLYRAVSDFKEYDIGLCLDDFGSGYANLNTILKLPFKVIKLDRSLLEGVSTNPLNAKFYQGIIAILLGLGYKIVSEGVETKEQVELLNSWHVTMMQGFYFSRPVCEADLVKLLDL